MNRWERAFRGEFPAHRGEFDPAATTRQTGLREVALRWGSTVVRRSGRRQAGPPEPRCPCQRVMTKTRMGREIRSLPFSRNWGPRLTGHAERKRLLADASQPGEPSWRGTDCASRRVSARQLLPGQFVAKCEFPLFLRRAGPFPRRDRARQRFHGDADRCGASPEQENRTGVVLWWEFGVQSEGRQPGYCSPKMAVVSGRSEWGADWRMPAKLRLV